MEDTGETASSTRDQVRALSTENEAGALRIFDNTGQDGPEDAAPFWHDEGGPDRWASAVENKMGPRRKPANASTLSRMDQKFRVYGWSEDARDPALGYMLMDSVKATDKRFEVEVAVAPPDNSSRTLRVNDLSLGGTLSVGLDPELHPNQLEYLLIDTGARAGQISKVDMVLPSGPTCMDPPQTRFFHLLCMRT